MNINLQDLELLKSVIKTCDLLFVTIPENSTKGDISEDISLSIDNENEICIHVAVLKNDINEEIKVVEAKIEEGVICSSLKNFIEINYEKNPLKKYYIKRIKSSSEEVIKRWINEIEKLIETQEKFLYNEILKFIPANYIEVNIEPKPDPKYFGENYLEDVSEKKYSLDYCFPLVKKVVKEILKSQGFINMKSEEFLNLPGGALGTNFDIEMNRILKELMKEKNFFEHKEKVQINIENILEKNGNNKTQIYEYKDVVLEVNKYYKKDKKKFDKIDFNSFTCIGVFQDEFCGKAFDILFFTKKENDKLYNMNLIQVKCSDSYVEKNEEELIPQIIYVFNKFSYLLKIKIKNIFLLYLSIYQKPKIFADSNRDKSFLYNVKTDKFVDFDNKEYKEFPFCQNQLYILIKIQS